MGEEAPGRRKPPVVRERVRRASGASATLDDDCSGHAECRARGTAWTGTLVPVCVDGGTVGPR
jgi:hypothetical protein